MKPSFILLAAATCLATPVFAGNKALEAPIKRIMDAFNRGDIPAVKAAAGWKIESWSWASLAAALTK